MYRYCDADRCEDYLDYGHKIGDIMWRYIPTTQTFEYKPHTKNDYNHDDAFDWQRGEYQIAITGRIDVKNHVATFIFYSEVSRSKEEFMVKAIMKHIDAIFPAVKEYIVF